MPSCVAGHSFGELTALHAAGVVGAADLLRIAQRRGRLMAEAEPGAMTAASCPLDNLEVLLQRWGTEVVIANRNSPNQGVISGPLRLSLRPSSACGRKASLSGACPSRRPSTRRRWPPGSRRSRRFWPTSLFRRPKSRSIRTPRPSRTRMTRRQFAAC